MLNGDLESFFSSELDAAQVAPASSEQATWREVTAARRRGEVWAVVAAAPTHEA